jgi:hypothetical protein
VAVRIEELEDARPPARVERAWTGRTRRTFRFGVSDLDTATVALAGFLLRGGVLLLFLPSAVLPSAIGIAGAAGMNAFAIDGRPTAWLFEVATIAGAGVAIWLLLSFIIGSLVDVWLMHAALDSDARAVRSAQPLPELRILLDMAAIRSICIVPLAGAVLWAGSRIYTAAYNELTTPANLVVPLPVRVIQDAADAVLVVALVWLASEVVGAIAVRRLVLLDRGVWRSLGGALVQIVKRPVSSAATVVVSYGASIVAVALAFAATTTTFDWCRVAARNEQAITINGQGDLRPAVFILAAVSLGVAWVVALALAGIASAWRSAAFTGETAAALSDPRRKAAAGGLGLSGSMSERSGD